MDKKSLKILLVEDEPEINDLWRYLLLKEAPNYSIHTVLNSMECLNFLNENNDIDCIISDYQMPGMNGVELLKELRTRGINIPFIFATGQGSEAVAREAFKSGAFDYFLKDVGFLHFSKIVNSVQQAVKQKQSDEAREKAEVALRHSENKFRSLVEGFNVGVVIVQDLKFIYANPKTVEFLGYSYDELVGQKSMLDVIHPEDRAYVMENVRKRITGEIQNIRCQFRMMKKDKSNIHVETHGALIDYEGKPAVLGTIVDITERKNIEDELKVRNQELHSLNKITEIIAGTMDLGRMLELVLEKTLSLSFLNVERKGIIFLRDEADPDTLVMRAQVGIPEELRRAEERIDISHCLCGLAARTGRTIKMDDCLKDLAHTVKYPDMTSHGHIILPIKSKDNVLGVMTFYTSHGSHIAEAGERLLLAVAHQLAVAIENHRLFTEQKALEEQLRQAQKMEAVGELAGGIAHDFNNIIGTINACASVLELKTGKESPLATYLDHIILASERAAALTKSLLAFSRKQVINLVPVNLNAIILKNAGMLSRLIGEDLELKTGLSAEDLHVMADPGQLEQVMMNLANNARDAMPNGGAITIKTGIEEENAVIVFSDTGVGMDENTSKSIFEPFFTTKEVGKGTGLGLSIVYGIIKQHRGTIEVNTRPGKGTSIKIYLPLIKKDPAEPRPRPVPALPRGHETVLLAEDDPALRGITREILQSCGYKVVEAVDGEDAKRIFFEDPARFSILILDVIMPKTNGKEVYEAVKGIRPDIKILFTSGHAKDIINKSGVVEEGLDFIAKPASPEGLLQKVREVLDRR